MNNNTQTDLVGAQQGGQGPATQQLAASPRPVVAAAPVAAPRPAVPVNLAQVGAATIRKTTIAGEKLLLTRVHSLKVDCTPDGHITVRLTQPPANGTVTVVETQDFSTYPPNNPHAACNSKRTPATAIYYSAFPGYAGPDQAVVNVFFPDGIAPVYTYNINVR